MHFVSVYASAKKSFLGMLAGMSIATSEVKPKAYEDFKGMKGKYSDTDALIKKFMPKISINNENKLKKK